MLGLRWFKLNLYPHFPQACFGDNQVDDPTCMVLLIISRSFTMLKQSKIQIWMLLLEGWVSNRETIREDSCLYELCCTSQSIDQQ